MKLARLKSLLNIRLKPRHQLKDRILFVAVLITFHSQSVTANNLICLHDIITTTLQKIC